MTSIPSVPFLEALLLLHKDENVPWQGKKLARFLYVSEEKANALLEELTAYGLIASDGSDPPGYRYAPAAEDLRSQVDLLAVAYSKNVIEISNLIHSGSGTRVQQFADAFKLRRDS